MKAYKHLVKYSLAQGYNISVWDGEEWQVSHSNKYQNIIDAIESVEEANIVIRVPEYGNRVAWALIIPFGLEDDETVADYTDNEFMMKWSLAYDKAQKGLMLLLEERKKQGREFPRIVLQFLVTGQNEHQIPSLKTWSKEIGVDELQLKTTQIYDFENGTELIPSDLGYSRYIPDGKGTWKLKKQMENKCWRMWQGAVVTWDGKVVPCCFDKDAKHVMGDLRVDLMGKIWHSMAYQQFRTQLLEDRSQIEICRNCSE